MYGHYASACMWLQQWLYLSCTVIMHQPACDSNNDYTYHVRSLCISLHVAPTMQCFVSLVFVWWLLLNFNCTKVQIKAQIWLVTLRHMCVYWCVKYWPIGLQLWKVLWPKLHLRRTQMTWECCVMHSFTFATVEIRGKSKTWKCEDKDISHNAQWQCKACFTF